MKLSRSVAVLFAPVWMASSAFASGKYDYQDMDVSKTAKVTLSNNVNWTQKTASRLVDYDIENVPLAKKAVGYESDTCDVPIQDVGFVTVDLGSSQLIDGVRVYLNHGDGRQYCNLFVNVWDDGTEPPTTPFKIPVTIAPTSEPSPKPTPAPSSLKPTLAPSPKPTPAPTTGTPTAGQPMIEASTAPPGFTSALFTGSNKPVPKSATENPGPRECAQCYEGLEDMCEDTYETKLCPADKPYCMVDLKNNLDASRIVHRYCGTLQKCYWQWYLGTSDKDKCIAFQDDGEYRQLDFECSFCCIEDGCNEHIRAHDWTPTGKFYKGGTIRRLEVEHDEEVEESDVYSSGLHNEYGPVVSPQGLDILFKTPRSIRYIRVWAGHNSVDNQVQLLEIAPLERKEFGASNLGEMADMQYDADLDSGTVTDVDTGSVTVSLTGSSSGDPHFKTWNGDKYDFHGGCSLVLLQNIGFANGLGLHIHIRTKISTWWSSIESAAVQIGPDTLEVTGGENGGILWINKESLEEIQDGTSFTLGGFHVQVHQVSPKQKRYRVELGNGDAMSIETYKDFVRVNVKAKNKEQFHGSLGLMGKYPSGLKVGRDGSTIVKDPNDFGAEWQVLASEPMLFHSMVGPQHPLECAMPSETATKKRRLGESLISEEDAALACARVDEDDRDACIFDVLATNDKDMAGSY